MPDSREKSPQGLFLWLKIWLMWLYHYVPQKLPLLTLLLPIAFTSFFSFLLYSRMAGIDHSISSLMNSAFFVAIVSFALLFIQLRMVDDLDDLEEDYWDKSLPPHINSLKTLMHYFWVSLVLILFTLFALNISGTYSLFVLVIAVLLTYTGPFLIKRYLSPTPLNLLLGLFVFEGTPALFFSYHYFAWYDSVESTLPASIQRIDFHFIAVVVPFFWIGYEFWKFSRKAHCDTGTLQPYMLKLPYVRVVLYVLLIVSLFVNYQLAVVAHLSQGFKFFALALPLVYLLLLTFNWPMQTNHSKEQGKEKKNQATTEKLWTGMSYMMLLELGLLLEIVIN